MDLATWRRTVAKLSIADAAKRAGIPVHLANTIEQRPDRAAVGSLSAYVRALGGRPVICLEFGSTTVELTGSPVSLVSTR